MCCIPYAQASNHDHRASFAESLFSLPVKFRQKLSRRGFGCTEMRESLIVICTSFVWEMQIMGSCCIQKHHNLPSVDEYGSVHADPKSMRSRTAEIKGDQRIFGDLPRVILERRSAGIFGSGEGS